MISDLNDVQEDMIIQESITELHTFLNKPWGENIDFINDNPNLVRSANTIAFQAFVEGNNDVVLLELLIILIESNNLLFHKKSNYKLYQKTSETLFELIKTPKSNFPKLLIAKFYSVTVYADFIFETPEITALWEENLIKSIEIFANHPMLTDELFLHYINVSQFYLYQGKLTQTHDYLFKAYFMLNSIHNQNYKALFYYHFAWFYVEKGDVAIAYEKIQAFFTNINENSVSPAIYLHALNIKGSIEFRLNHLDAALLLAKKCYDSAIKFYESEIEDVIAENLLTIGRCYLINGNYLEAAHNIKRSIEILEQIFGSSIVDPSQAVAHRILGDLYLAQGEFIDSYKEFDLVYRFYQSYYEDKIHDIYEVSNLYGSFVRLGITTQNTEITKRFLKLLMSNFAEDNVNLQEAFLLLERVSTS